MAMLSNTYETLKAAAAPDDKAREAAEEIAGFENRLISIDTELSRLEARFSMLQWIMGNDGSHTRRSPAHLRVPILTWGERKQCPPSTSVPRRRRHVRVNGKPDSSLRSE